MIRPPGVFVTANEVWLQKILEEPLQGNGIELSLGASLGAQASSPAYLRGRIIASTRQARTPALPGRFRAPAHLSLGLFYMDGAVVADGAHFRSALADHAPDWPATDLNARPEFQREFGAHRPVVTLDRQVEITFRRQGQNDITVGAEKQVTPAFVKLTCEKHAAVCGFRRYVFATNVVQQNRAVGSVRFYAPFGVDDLHGATDRIGSRALTGAANNDIPVEGGRHDMPARVRDRDR